MQVLLDDKKAILAYAVVGEIDGAVQIDDTQIPINFEDDFKPLYFVLKNDEVIKNEDFEKNDEVIGDDEVPTIERISQLENLVLQLLSGGDEL
ncbi:DUF2977 domain-containing protein [Brochothrix thermosphacta]|uniref:DUF2977 domain-containing protein n=1 Tax=Brochothrix thermosphacta TaxID=2756 RepID=UPI0003E8AB51|nr:DUF2977 domain-containing protein [Brochothrix thermosphacta]EUJ38210.1 phage-like protein [Brochothrix thermosphacta DSM 20171 = FSL F6-1036]ODJ49193.1 hypothetical protein BFR34_06025 [Brochothrix thermosphacta DSM 20171 = FSL F6-1036]